MFKKNVEFIVAGIATAAVNMAMLFILLYVSEMFYEDFSIYWVLGTVAINSMINPFIIRRILTKLWF